MAVSKDMKIAEIVEQHPEAVAVFLKHGLFCFGCGVARFENLEQGASVHGIDSDLLVTDINQAIEEKAKVEARTQTE